MIKVRQETADDYSQVYSLVKAPFDFTENVFMAFNLYGKNTMLNDVVEYSKDFFKK